MNTPPSPPGAERTDGSPVQIGALVPLTRPGWVEAGRHLLAGLELGAREVNDAGGIGGRPVELVVRDTAADPRRAAAAVDELARLGVAALAGEYHSVVARAAAARADALGLPFLCSSAVLDALTEEPTEWVARLAPAQSHGWQAPAGRFSSPACPASASGNGRGRQSRSSTGIRRNPVASGSCTPAERARAGGPGRHGVARTARPGRASLTSRASRTTRVPFTRTCRMPVVGRVLAE